MYIDGSQGSQTPVQDDYRRKYPLKERKRNRYYVKVRYMHKHKQTNSSASNPSHKQIGVKERRA